MHDTTEYRLTSKAEAPRLLLPGSSRGISLSQTRTCHNPNLGMSHLSSPATTPDELSDAVKAVSLEAPPNDSALPVSDAKDPSTPADEPAAPPAGDAESLAPAPAAVAEEEPGAEEAKPLPPTSPVPGGDSVRLFLGDLSRSTTEETLAAHFGQFGPVMNTVVKHPRGHTASAAPPRSFGFVSVRAADVTKILSAVHVVDGVPISPEVAKKRPAPGSAALAPAPTAVNFGGEAAPPPAPPDRPRLFIPHQAPPLPRKIFVGGLSHHTTEEALAAHFSQFGNPVDVVVMAKGSGPVRKPRGFGFVTFDSPAAVDLAVASRYQRVDGHMAEVKVAIPRDAIQRDGPGGGGGGMMRGFAEWAQGMRLAPPWAGGEQVMQNPYGQMPMCARARPTRDPRPPPHRRRAGWPACRRLRAPLA